MRALVSRLFFLSTPCCWALAAMLLGSLSLIGACGPGDSLVVVHVQGLVSNITELNVTMQLDGVSAHNSRPLPESGDSAFVVYKEMQRFGIEIPPDTNSLTLDIKGFDTNRAVVRAGSGTLDLAQSHELNVALTGPPAAPP